MVLKDPSIQTDAATDPKALQKIMHALQRLLKIGIYYPSGHSILDGAIDRFLVSMRKVAGTSPHIRFAIKEDQLHLQDIALDHSHFFVQEFKETLCNLAIVSLEIDREIKPSEVQAFIGSLLLFRTKFGSTKVFTPIDLDQLPISVRISQVEYLATEHENLSNGSKVTTDQPTHEAFLESLSQQGLNQEQIVQCQQFLETAALHSQLKREEAEHAPQLATWDDVERLLLKLVTTNSDDDQSEGNSSFNSDINTLTSILTHLEKDSTEKKSLDAIHLLISLVKKREEQGERQKPLKNQKGTDEVLPAAQIKAFIRKHEIPASQFGNFDKRDKCEVLSIIMQLISHTHTLQIQVRLQLLVREILTQPLEHDEWEILIQGVYQLLQSAKDEELPIPLMMILEALRKSPHTTSLALLERVGQGCISVELKKLLPYIVNELLLVGSKEASEVFHELCNIALFLPPSDLIESLPILEKLDAFAESQIALNLFYAIPQTHYPLFAPLLNTAIGKLLAKRILQGFSHKPPSNIIDALLPLLKSSEKSHRNFLHEYLINSRFSKPTKTLQSLGYQIVLEGLQDISDDQRKDFNILKTIRILPHLQGDDIHLILQNIIHKKRLFFIPEWPAQCRKTAREALSTHLSISGK